MATLTAWNFDTPTGADALLLRLKQLEVREKVTPGTSAVFLLIPEAVHDHLAKELQGFDADLISCMTPSAGCRGI